MVHFLLLYLQERNKDDGNYGWNSKVAQREQYPIHLQASFQG